MAKKEMQTMFLNLFLVKAPFKIIHNLEAPPSKM